MHSVLTLLLLTPQQPPPPNHALELLSLRHVQTAAATVIPPPWGTLLPAAPSDEPPRPIDLLWTQAQDDGPGPESILDWVGSLQRAAIDDGRLSLTMHGGVLYLRGEPPLVAQGKRDALALAGAATRSVRLEVAVLDLGNQPPPGALLSAAECERLLANGTVRWRGAATARHGDPTSIGASRWTQYVRDVSVEVAMEATIAYPTTALAFDGPQFLVVPHALIGSDDLVLQCQFAYGEARAPNAVQSTGVAGQPVIDQPQRNTAFGACSARVANGGALAVTLSGSPATGGTQVFLVRASQGPAPQLPAGITLLPISALHSHGLGWDRPLPDNQPHLGEDPAPKGEQVAEPTRLCPTDELMEIVRIGLGEAAESDFDLRGDGRYLVVLAGPDKAAAARDLLVAVQDRLLRCTTVTHQGSTAEPGSPADGNDLVVLRAPTLLGRNLQLVRLVETTVLQDVFVEIAQKATAVNPNAATLQFGTWLSASPTPLDDAVHLELAARTAWGRIAEPRRIDPAGMLQLSTSQTRLCLHHGPVVPGTPIAHGDGPVLPRNGDEIRSRFRTTVGP